MAMFGVDARPKGTDVVTKHGSKWLRSWYASWILAGISFAESVFVPIIIDPFLIALIMANQKRWRWYVGVSVVASVIGGVCAYLLGVLFFDTLGVKLISWYGLESTFATISNSLNESGFVFVFIGAFTPIPYKIVALSSGLLQINFLTFIIASIIGRLLRLGLVGLAAHVVGPRALSVIRHNLYYIAAGSGFLMIIYLTIQLLK